MKNRELPPTGGGAPILTHSAIALPSTNGEPRTTITTTLTMSSEAEMAGRAVVALIREGCRSEEVERVATVRFFFPSIAERVPEFHALMDEFVERNELDAVEIIMREPGTPGRRRSSLAFVGLIEQVMQEHPGWTAKGATTWLLENLVGPIGDRLPSLKRLQNAHSELKDIYALWRQSLFVHPNLLTVWPWRPPGYVSPLEHFLANAKATRLSSSVVFHLPETPVEEGVPNVEVVVPKREQQPIEPDESEQSGLSQQPPRKR